MNSIILMGSNIGDNVIIGAEVLFLDVYRQILYVQEIPQK